MSVPVSPESGSSRTSTTMPWPRLPSSAATRPGNSQAGMSSKEFVPATPSRQQKPAAAIQWPPFARSIATEDGELPDAAVGPVLDAAAGLTRYEAEGAFSLSLVRHNQLVPQSVFEQKRQMLKKRGLLSLHQGSETFADLGGLDSL